ncbi:cupin domain-containing protein [Gordonia sp. X0973]|uniref:(R)-mandelonitrile lyase n=1 Tax=Gordonia sp. X0973 TaxID=2742602 RepID=UPI000F53AC25|nr:cupin domain-containing protein [Gordonia sp. X0973]QKT07839.1 cupin domain-containing protein [Gordonia sp. X0973]
MRLTPISATGKGPADRFTGDVYVTTMATPTAPPYLSSAIVHFMPGAHTNWHMHPNGQTLHVIEGIALVGTRDGTVIAARPGESVTCEPGVDHWHGATAETLAVHVAMIVASADHSGTDWLEPVPDEVYDAAQVAAQR